MLQIAICNDCMRRTDEHHLKYSTATLHVSPQDSGPPLPRWGAGRLGTRCRLSGLRVGVTAAGFRGIHCAEMSVLRPTASLGLWYRERPVVSRAACGIASGLWTRERPVVSRAAIAGRRHDRCADKATPAGAAVRWVGINTDTGRGAVGRVGISTDTGRGVVGRVGISIDTG